MVIKFSDLEFKLLRILINNDQYQSIDTLTQKLGFSKRSAYYYIKNISEKLIQNKISPPRNVKGQGYYLTDQSKKQLRTMFCNSGINDKHRKVKEKYSAQERQMIILVLNFGLSSYVTISKLAELFGVTRNTIVKDFKGIEQTLEKYEFSLVGTSKGHILVGSEFAIRNFFQDHLKEFQKVLTHLEELKLTYDLLDYHNLHELALMVKDWLHKIEYQSSRSFSDDAIQHMEDFYSFVLLRILSKYYLTQQTFIEQKKNYKELRAREEYKTAGDFLAHLGIDTNQYKAEIFYLESLILSSQLQEISSINELDVKKNVQKATKQVIGQFKQFAEVHFKDEKKLEKELYIHMLSTYYRVKFNHQYKNSTVLSIKENYPDVYTYTSMSIAPFEKLFSQSLNENEVGLIAIYFGAHLLNQNNKYPEILLVCSSGLGTSQLLKNQLATIFPDCLLQGPITKRDYDDFETIHSDVVVSTIPLEEKGKKVMVVDPVMNESKVNQLRRKFISDNLININGIDQQFNALMDVIADNTQINDMRSLENGIKEVLSRALNPKVQLKGRYQPLLSELINQDTIVFSGSKNMNWEEAIKLAASPLERKGNIEKSYTEAMISNVKENGPYINIGDRIALAHARPENGVNQLGMSVLRLSQSIDLVDNNHPIQLIFVLAAIDDHAHLKALSELANMLNDKNKLESLILAQHSSDIQKIIEEGED